MPRLFYALWPEPSVRAELARAARALDIRHGRAVRDENLHLTLVFLGEIDEITCRALCEGGQSPAGQCFVLEIAATGWWRTGRVAWLAPFTTPPALDALVLALRAHAREHGCSVEDRPYRAHVTVARDVRPAPRAAGSIAVTWPVADYALVASETAPAGSRYTVLARWPLRSP